VATLARPASPSSRSPTAAPKRSARSQHRLVGLPGSDETFSNSVREAGRRSRELVRAAGDVTFIGGRVKGKQPRLGALGAQRWPRKAVVIESTLLRNLLSRLEWDPAGCRSKGSERSRRVGGTARKSKWEREPRRRHPSKLASTKGPRGCDKHRDRIAGGAADRHDRQLALSPSSRENTVQKGGGQGGSCIESRFGVTG